MFFWDTLVWEGRQHRVTGKILCSLGEPERVLLSKPGSAQLPQAPSVAMPLLAGDFDLPSIDLNSDPPCAADCLDQSFLDALTSLGLSQ